MYKLPPTVLAVALRTGNGFSKGQEYLMELSPNGRLYETQNSNNHPRVISPDELFEGAPSGHFITEDSLWGCKSLPNCWKIIAQGHIEELTN